MAFLAEQCRTVNSVTAYHLVASFSPLRLGFPPLPASSEAKLANTEGWWKLQCVLGQERERDAAPKCHHDHSPNGLSLMAARPVVVCLHNKKKEIKTSAFYPYMGRVHNIITEQTQLRVPPVRTADGILERRSNISGQGRGKSAICMLS
ncbi:hypothetical protein A9K55_003534 [Cordyceps militaris]|uniref:Uncharacterized protein n=1 Tax=Cordyceps militaris TaxID=73501 RepID=A0A2H4S674_CORMI|nr:hypothetical protein A9K55_003534 [Cordyceps militaris]